MPYLFLHRPSSDQIFAKQGLQDLPQDPSPSLPSEVDQNFSQERVPALQVSVPIKVFLPDKNRLKPAEQVPNYHRHVRQFMTTCIDLIGQAHPVKRPLVAFRLKEILC